MSNKTIQFINTNKIGRGGLEWVQYEGPGKESLSGVMQYLATLLLSGDEAETLKEIINDFWKENKPKGKKPKSLGYYAHRIKTAEVDDDDAPIYEETGKTAFIFKTGVAYRDGKPKVIKIYNAKGNEVNLQGKKIGNESEGFISGAMDIYAIKTGEAGVSLYLNAIQLTKFDEYTGGDAGFEAADGDGWTGEDDESGFESVSDTKAKPRL
jgi:hypothetical protein